MFQSPDEDSLTPKGRRSITLLPWHMRFQSPDEDSLTPKGGQWQPYGSPRNPVSVP